LKRDEVQIGDLNHAEPTGPGETSRAAAYVASYVRRLRITYRSPISPIASHAKIFIR